MIPDLREWARNFVRAAAAQLHDVNGHLRWEGNKPTSEPFDWTTNCQHGDCINARSWLAAAPFPDTGAEERLRAALDGVLLEAEEVIEHQHGDPYSALEAIIRRVRAVR
jgi:hypothetical protein